MFFQRVAPLIKPPSLLFGVLSNDNAFSFTSVEVSTKWWV